MTKEEILALEAGIKLDTIVATEIFKVIYSQGQPYYSTDISAAWQVEERMKELELMKDYADELAFLVLHPLGYDISAMEQVFAAAHASPEIRCKAALLAKLEGD